MNREEFDKQEEQAKEEYDKWKKTCGKLSLNRLKQDVAGFEKKLVRSLEIEIDDSVKSTDTTNVEIKSVVFGLTRMLYASSYYSERLERELEKCKAKTKDAAKKKAPAKKSKK